MLATAPVEVDKEFDYGAEVTKTWVDRNSGKRYIRGVASGVAEDRDGERVSKNAISRMLHKIRSGGVKLTASHSQDWLTEFGEVVKGEHDPKTDELIIECELPPEGQDPIADKAWRDVNKRSLGFSVGGRLRSAFHELVPDTGKRRKVLDDIDLAHVALTAKPSYGPSFAQAVAKTFDGPEPDDADFIEQVEKDVTGSWAPGGGENSGQDSKGTGPRNAGTRSPNAKGPSVDDDGKDDEPEDEDLPKAKSERHLACPNCGHEFAADLPVSPSEQMLDDEDDDHDGDDDADTGKSLAEEPMALSDTIEQLRGELVEKTDTEAPEGTEVEVEKTETLDEGTDVAKIATSLQNLEQRNETVEKQVGEGFELIAKALQGIHARLDELPQGRKSHARTLPPTVGHVEPADVAKTITDDDDALTAFKKLNAQNPRYAHLAA